MLAAWGAALLGTSRADPCGTAACWELPSGGGQTVRTLRSCSLPSVVIDSQAVKVLTPPDYAKPPVSGAAAGDSLRLLCGEGGIPCGARRYAAALLGTLWAYASGAAACCASLSGIGWTVRTLRSRSLPFVAIDSGP